MKTIGGTSVSRVFDVFKVDGRWCAPIVLAFLVINAIVFVNAVLHDPRFGYDAPAHLAYARTLAEGRLPTPADSHEFFCPPLPYTPAALFWRLLDGPSSDARGMMALKLAQMVQGLCSLIVCWSVLAIAMLIRADRWMRVAALVALAIVPTYYRTFAMIRGEPMMVALLLLGAYWTLKCFALDRPTLRRAIVAGVLLGGAVLSRQWAFFALPALGLIGFWRVVIDSPNRKRTIASGIALLASFALVGGWHYARLQYEFGSFRAFNRPPDDEDGDASAKQSTSTLLRAMVTSPVRHAFDGHPFWLFYADTWGDYSRYFLISARDHKGRLVKSALIDRTIATGRSKGDNVASMTPYLSRVCTLSIVPSALLMCGMIWGVWSIRRWPRHLAESNAIIIPSLILMVMGTVAGYIWFVATYPNVRLDTVKASYPLQIFPFLAIVVAAWWCKVRERSPRVALFIAACVLMIFVHHLPAMVTRYVGSF